ncbi:sulfotransferase family protein [Roseiconus lacunae]|uniref:Sulfotransferase n=1 Tax=Roseiconus lacunae TaxID=2605694 RepID=A0ABT7PQS1_9BACT|nr:sulfotransferase [Roseiconus lacunae]MDM4018842.1 sulfotransferase [Roseiconus lacunae]
MIETPNLVFVFGAVGSGNTFMYSCLTASPSTYGVNEDAMGATLERLIQSQTETGRCPHAVEAFISFLDALRADRNTLVLKTPSNLRRLTLLRKHLPDARFVYMIREPHAAIVSGLKRHDANVMGVADHWETDARSYLQHCGGDMVAIAYEDLVRSPDEVFETLDRQTMPIDDEVKVYAHRMNRPERAGANRWKEKVDAVTASEIEREVRERSLSPLYGEIVGATATEGAAAESVRDNAGTRLKKNLFRIYYRFAR